MHAILFHILFALIMGALSWAYPPKPKPAPSIDEPTLKKLYAKASGFAVLGLFVWTPIWAIVIGYGLHAIATWHHNTFDDTPHAIVATFPAWCCVGAVFGFALSRKSMEGTIRYFMGPDVVEAVNIMTEREYGVANEALWRGMQRLLTLAGIVAYLFVSDYSLFVYDDHVAYNKFQSLFQSQTIPFADIEAIQLERDPKREAALVPTDPAYVLRFRNGEVWRSNFNDLAQVRPVMDVLLERSGITLDTVVIDR